MILSSLDIHPKDLLNKETSEIIKMIPFNLMDIDTKEDYQNLIE